MKTLVHPTPERTTLTHSASGSVVRAPRAPLANRPISENSALLRDAPTPPMVGDLHARELRLHAASSRSQSSRHQPNIVQLRLNAIPPCSRGGPIEATWSWPGPSPPLPFRRVHAAAPLKPTQARAGSHVACSFRRVHAAAPLKRSRLRHGVALVDAFRRVHAAAPLKRTALFD
jgi:hypothetical protein